MTIAHVDDLAAEHSWMIFKVYLEKIISLGSAIVEWTPNFRVKSEKLN